MTNALKSYVRATVLSRAKEYAHPKKRRTLDSTKAAFIDALQGTDSGWWNDLIYTAPMLDMAHRYRRDIVAAVREYMDETGEGYGDSIGRPEDHLSLGLLIDAAGEPITWERYSASANSPAGQFNRDDLLCDAKLFGLRFAVEWLTNQVASELGLNL